MFLQFSDCWVWNQLIETRILYSIFLLYLWYSSYPIGAWIILWYILKIRLIVSYFFLYVFVSLIAFDRFLYFIGLDLLNKKLLPVFICYHQKFLKSEYLS